MNRIHPLYRYILAFGVVVLLSLPSCREVGEIPELLDKDGITLIISEGEAYTPATKSDGQLSPVSSSTKLMEEGELSSLYLTVTECSIHTGLADTITTQTKGAPYSGNNIGTFHITAFLNSNTSAPFIDKNLTSDGTAIGTGYYWPITTPESTISFFGYGKNKTTGKLNISTPYVLGDDASHEGSFTYSLPDTLDSNEEHPDLVFAIAPNQKKGEDGVVPMKFYHALSSIVFTVGSVPEQIKIKSVSFENIYGAGSCEYTYTASGLSFNWTQTGVRKNYSETFEKEIGTDASTAPTQINTADQTFMMIPQTFTDGSSTLKVNISFQTGSGESRMYPIDIDLHDITPVWEPGKQYTFRISSPEEVEIDVTDELSDDNMTKKNLEIKNSGIADAWIRVAIVGEWVKEVQIEGNDEIITLGSWNPGDQFTTPSPANVGDGTFTSIDINNKWYYNAVDNYFYLKKRLKRGTTADPLFDSYTLKETPPYADAYLELNIIVQAVLDQNEFPADVQSQLTKE